VSHQFGYWIELQGTKFGEEEEQWIHALPLGEYEHPVYGKMKFDPDTVKQYADNVNSKVRGIDLDIDYDHKEKTSKAAGWVKEAKVQPDGLHLRVKWTPEGAKAVKDGEYRYFSPEFQDAWKDAHGVEHKNVLFGGALTNRPYLKDLMPVNLSEINEPPKEEGDGMDPALLRQLLGLEANATNDQVTAKIAELQNGPTPPSPPAPPAPPAPVEPAKDEPVLTGAALTEAFAKMLDEHPMFKALKESVEITQRNQQLAEVRGRLEKVTNKQGGRAFVLPPSVIDAVAEASVSGDPVKLSEGMVTAFEQFARTGMVELGERGRVNGGSNEKDATQVLAERVQAKMASHLQATGKPLHQTEAIRMVCAEDPELYMSYREDSYAGGKGE
jgi:hypothetical protein